MLIASVDAQEQCSTYAVAPRDTLSQIASRTGVRGGFQILFDANPGILRSANIIAAGQDLRFLCVASALPVQETSAADVPAHTNSSAGVHVEIWLGTGTGYVPFADDCAEFHGLNVCLPDGYTNAVLAGGRLTESTISLTCPIDPDNCVRFLAWGDVGAVSLEQRQEKSSSCVSI